MSPGRAAAPTALLVSLALAGCVGSTEPATDVQAKQATLNARGTANNGPATSFFEYWPTGAPDLARRTDGQRWPAGASGAFSETARRLAADQPYSFRACGRDEQAQGDPICAGTRTFTTRPATEDAVHGSYFHPGSTGLSVNATSGPSGEQPRGSVSYTATNSGGYVNFQGFATCLAVDGERAAIGAVGREFRTGIPDYGTRDANVLITIEDGGGTAPDTHGPHYLGTAQPGLTPPDCGAASFGQQREVVSCSYCAYPRREGDFIVDDAPAARR